MEKKEVTVSLELKPTTVKVAFEGELSDKEILALAKEEFIKSITKEFPTVSYSIIKSGEGVPLTFDTAFIGQVVEVNGDKRTGVVLKINKKTITVAVTAPSGGGMLVNGYPVCFTALDTAEGIVLPVRAEHQKEGSYWLEGNTGYFADTKNGEVHHVVVTKITSADNHHVFRINENTNNYWKVPKHLVNRLLCDTREEAEKLINK